VDLIGEINLTWPRGPGTTQTIIIKAVLLMQVLQFDSMINTLFREADLRNKG
jgi:hypothetical protein